MIDHPPQHRGITESDSVVLDDEEPEAEVLKREAARLRKQYEGLKVRLTELARREGLTSTTRTR